MNWPSAEELRDPDKRELFLIELALGVAKGEVKSKDANSARSICKEIRDNTDLRSLTREIQVCRDLFKEVLARKARLTVEEIEEIYRRVWWEVRAGEPVDDGAQD